MIYPHTPPRTARVEEGYLFSTKHPKDIVFFKGSIHIQEFNQRDEKTAVDYDEDDDDDDDDDD